MRDRRLRQRDRGSSTIEAVTATLAGTGTTAQAISGHGDAEWFSCTDQMCRNGERHDRETPSRDVLRQLYRDHHPGFVR